MKIELVLFADRRESAPRIARWHHEQWGRADGLTYGQVLARLESFGDRQTAPMMVLAELDGECVGSAQLKRHEMARYPDFEFWLGGVYVDQRVRGRGVASRLVEEVLERARRAGIERLYLQTEELSGGLYVRHGFERLEEVELEGYRALVMTASLVD